ncbi:hypothetical protein [Microcystis phage Mwe-Yong1]|nr:hypothetical protein [Microcystis phage Mwe-Yong1]
MTDVVALAHAAISDRTIVDSLTADEITAICRALVIAEARPQISDELAAATSTYLATEALLEKSLLANSATPDLVATRAHTFHAFKTAFREEFPDV